MKVLEKVSAEIEEASAHLSAGQEKEVKSKVASQAS